MKTVAILAVGLVAACATGVTFQNQSDTWVNVKVYVADPDERMESGWLFATTGTMQVAPGRTTTYALAENPKYKEGGAPVVHVEVTPAGATWENPEPFWIEVLTPVPITIVASGSREAMQFNSENGMVQAIPENLVSSGAYQRVVMAPVVPEKEQPKEAAAPAEAEGDACGCATEPAGDG